MLAQLAHLRAAAPAADPGHVFPALRGCGLRGCGYLGRWCVPGDQQISFGDSRVGKGGGEKDHTTTTNNSNNSNNNNKKHQKHLPTAKQQGMEGRTSHRIAPKNCLTSLLKSIET